MSVDAYYRDKERAKRQLRKNYERLNLHPGELLFSIDTPTKWLYYILSGRILIFKTDSIGNEHILRIAHKGDLLGYTGISNVSRYCVSAKAIEASEVLPIPLQEFKNIMRI